MTRYLALFSFALVFGCSVDTTAESDSIDFERHADQTPPTPDGKALVSLAYAQSDIESVVELDVFDVFNASPYPAHPGLASCMHLPLPEDVDWLESECPGVTGWGWEIELDRCQLGPGARTSGSVYLGYESMKELSMQANLDQFKEALQNAELSLEEGSEAIWFDMQLGPDNADPIRVCGVQDGNLEDHATEFKAKVPLKYQDVLYAHWQGQGASYLTEDRGKVFVREGLLDARFVNGDGSTRTLQVNVDHNVRREFGLYPESGSVKVRDQATQLEYHPFTRYTGEVSVTHRDGTVRTHNLKVE